MGAIYAMVGIGFSFIYRVTKVLNFAQGEFLMLGGMVAISMTSVFGSSLALALIVGILAVTMTGLLFHLGAIRVLGKAEKGALLPQARYGNRLAVFLIRILYGHKYTDMGPFRAIRRDALTKLGMSDTNFGWTAEMQVKALKHQLRIMEIPVSYRKRTGHSKITGTVSGTIRAGYKIIFTILKLGAYTHYRRAPKEMDMCSST